MWNTRYLSANKLPKPKEWSDLIKPIYYDHIGMSSPSRSGTTHLTLEAILQGEGFLKGWQTMKFISGNFKTVAATSFAVPDGVNSGDFGIGIVIDFFWFIFSCLWFSCRICLSNNYSSSSSKYCNHQKCT